MLVLLLVFAPLAGANSPLRLSEAMGNVPLWSAMELLTEPIPAETLFSDPQALPFRPVQSAGESIRDMGVPAYWVRITVSNPHSEPITWRLQHQNGLARGVEPTVLQNGQPMPEALRRLPHYSPLYEVRTPAGATQEIYVRRTTPGHRLVFRASQWHAWSVPAFHAYSQRDAAIKGATYGIMLALTLYNLFLFLSLRIAAYGYYVLFASLFGLTWLSWEGLLLHWFSLGKLPLFLEPALLACLGALAGTEFTRRLLETAARAPRLNTFLCALRLVFAAGAVVALFRPWGPTIATAALLPVASVPVVAAMVWLRGYAPARYLVLGLSLFTVGGVVLIIMQLAGIAVAGGALRWVPGLQVAELLLMSFALADRMRSLQQAKAAVEQAHRAVLERSQLELEAQVRARTAELESAKSRAEMLARIDPLTGLANRRALLEQGAVELQRARRYGRALSVVMVDIDHFKRVNDTYGHAAGDQVLIAFAAQLTRHLRETDQAGRLGGEEFAVLLPEADTRAAYGYAERLRKVVAEAPIELSDTTLRITVSLGIATLEPGDTGLDALLHRADLALYQAKESGRNRTGGWDNGSTVADFSSHPGTTLGSDTPLEEG